MTADTTRVDRSGPRPLLGVGVTLVLSVIALPFNVVTLLWLSISLTNYDDSGQGGPFRTCSADSIICTGTNPFAAAAAVLVLLVITACVGLGGQKAGRWDAKWLGRGGYALLSAFSTLGMIGFGILALH